MSAVRQGHLCCLPGTFCDKDSPVCTSCPPSTYSSTGGRRYCNLCRVCEGESVCFETESFCCPGWTRPCDLQPPKTGGRLYTGASPSLGNLGQDQLWSLFTNWSLLRILSLTGADTSVHSRCSQSISWTTYCRCLKDQPPAAQGLRGIQQSQLTHLSEGVNLTLWG